MMRRKCILHIGIEKTGTTSIQNFLAVNRHALLKKGFLYSNFFPAHIAVYAMNDDKENEDDQMRYALQCAGPSLSEFRKAFHKKLKAEVINSRADTIIYSSEFCHSRLFFLEEKRRLHELLSSLFDEIKIICYLRRQDKQALSFFSTRIKAGGTDFDNVFPDDELIEHNDFFRHYFNYEILLKDYMDVFGKENIIVRIFDRKNLISGDVVLDFVNVLSLELAKNTSLIYPEKKKNISLDKKTLKILSLLNKEMPQFDAQGRHNVYRDGLIEVLELCSKGCKVLVNRDRVLSFMKHFEDSNNWVRETFFPSNNALDFSEIEAAEYPEEAEDSFNISFEEAARYLQTMWKYHIDERRSWKGGAN